MTKQEATAWIAQALNDQAEPLPPAQKRAFQAYVQECFATLNKPDAPAVRQTQAAPQPASPAP